MSASHPESLPDARTRAMLGEVAADEEESLEPEAAGPGGIHAVPGERGIPSVNRARSLQSRASSMLAITLMMSLGVGLLTWYYARVLTRPTRALQSAQTLARQRAQGEMPLPSLGPISPPLMRAVAAPTPASVAPTPSAEVGRMTALQALLGPPSAWPAGAPGGAMAPARTSGPTPAHRALDRRLAGPAFASSSSGASCSGEGEISGGQMSGSPTDPNTAVGPPWMPYRAAGAVAPGGAAGSAVGRETLAEWLRPQVTPAVMARVLPTERFLLPKGAFIDCTLETAIDSTLPGMTTCVTATDTLSADGTVVLLSRGTKLVGETRGEVQQGQSRIFVLWSEARTPSGVVVPLDSPGTDALGRSGLTGHIERHFWERFGAAILVSVIDGAVQAGVESSSRGGTILVNPSGSEDVMTEVLKGTVDIPPTIVVAQGARIQVLVARDVDFRSVYRLVPVSQAGAP